MDTFCKSTPIFILGPHRSGTSHLRKSISGALNIPSFTEGYIWPVLTGANQSMDHVLNGILGGEDNEVGKNFTIKQFGRKTILERLSIALDKLHQEKLGTSQWLDKTPGEEMIRSLPIIADYYPEARFIFMQRNGIDNVLSRARRFRRQPFDKHCKDWAASVISWQQLKSQLSKDYFLEIDQRHMAEDPAKLADRLAIFLEIADQDKIAKLVELLSGQTENTSERSLDASVRLFLEDSGWEETKVFDFLFYCYAAMKKMQYPVFRDSEKSVRRIYRNLNQWCIFSDEIKKGVNHTFHPNTKFESWPTVGYLGVESDGKNKFVLRVDPNFARPENPGVIIRLEAYETGTNSCVLDKKISINPYHPFIFQNKFAKAVSQLNLKISIGLPEWASSNSFTGVRLQFWLEE